MALLDRGHDLVKAARADPARLTFLQQRAKPVHRFLSFADEVTDIVARIRILTGGDLRSTKAFISSVRTMFTVAIPRIWQSLGDCQRPCMSWLPPGILTVRLSSTSLVHIWQARREWRVT